MIRKCYNKKTGRGAIWHGFFQANDGEGQPWGAVAIVELASGTTEEWDATNVVFFEPPNISQGKESK